ncbi:hypothetical protein BpHYR1_020743 [Brachionus plicatilis]|uniref:Uncharacterized protein n=1 Tax=Brachionus plicatilis TaxID=10195 RepID=A0A3M7QCU0_BRAPC|nr:hypothetical protein BpHYR1_020743 [Brachionus plicatilis]
MGMISFLFTRKVNTVFENKNRKLNDLVELPKSQKNSLKLKIDLVRFRNALQKNHTPYLYHYLSLKSFLFSRQNSSANLGNFSLDDTFHMNQNFAQTN